MDEDEECEGKDAKKVFKQVVLIDPLNNLVSSALRSLGELCLTKVLSIAEDHYIIQENSVSQLKPMGLIVDIM